MTPLAIVARHLGAEVSGCDRAPHPDRAAELARAGIRLDTGHDAAHVRPGALVVATSVADRSEPEVRAAAECGVLYHRTDLVAAVLRDRPGAGVTGSHGKGTVAALAVAAMRASGIEPLAGIGVPVPSLGGVVVLGSGPSVIEVDDSDLTLDRVSCRVAVVTNLDDDHPHLGHRLSESVDAVGRFVARAKDIVILGRSPRSATLRAVAQTPVWQFGREFHARVRSWSDVAVVRISGPGGERIDARIRLVGPATAQNAALGYATALALGADPQAAAAGLESVDRIERRLEPVGVRDGVRVYDDFGGKHPVNVREGLRAIRRRHPGARIVAVFEPFGPYLPRWAQRYGRALALADQVVAAPTFFLAGYSCDPGLERPWWDACPVNVYRASSREEAADVAMACASNGDVVVFFAQANAARVMARRAVSGVG